MPVSLQSLLIQGAALIVAVLIGRFLVISFGYAPGLISVVLTQSVFAAVASAWLGQPRWWQLLHVAFLPLLFAASHAGVPSWVYLTGFVVLVLFYWSSFRTRVPLYLSDRRAWQALVRLLPHDKPFAFIDLGSGFGGVPFHLESHFPEARLTGTEIAPAPWLISRLRGWLRRSRVSFLRRDYRKLDLGAYDAVFAFLSPAAMPALWQQAQRQMSPGSLFVSLSFAAEGREPDHVVALGAGDRHTLFAWRMTR